MRQIALAAAIALFGAGAAVAGEQPSPLQIAQHIFEKADSDNDGALTREEHEAAGLGRFGASFVDFDVDSDSRVTWDEYKAVFERHHPPAGERPA